MTEQEQQLIDDVMDTLDFARIAKVMTFLEWKWMSPPYNCTVPTEYEIRREVRTRLKTCIEQSNRFKNERYATGTGGFFYEVWRDAGAIDVISVRFELTSTDAQVEKGEYEF